MVRHAALAAAGAVAAIALPSAAQGAAINVTTNADAVASDGACSLREAVQAANTDAAVSDCPAGSGADQISLGATTYTLTAGQLGVTTELTITGAGAASTTIDGNHNGRVLNVTAAGKLTVDSVLITGGQTGSGGTGFNSESHDPTVPGGGGAGGDGGNGGGIANAGTLTINASRVSGNTTGNGGLGGNGFGSDGTGPIPHGGSAGGGTGGAGGKGGGVYSTGTLTITASKIDGNVTGNGGTGGDGTGGAPNGTADAGGGFGGAGGQGGSGGGVYAAGTLPTIAGSTISGNTTGNGGPAGNGHGHDGVAGANAGEGKGGTGGQGGSGGGIWFDTALAAFDDTISGNTTGGGNFGGIGFGGDGAGNSGNGTGGTGGRGGDGGGVGGGHNTAGNLDLERSLLQANHTGGGGGGGTGFAAGATEKGGNGGNGGGGGGLDNATQLAFAINVTFTGNTTGNGGDRGTGSPPSPAPSTFGKGGTGGEGAAAHGRLGTLGLLQTTVIGNSVGAGGTGNPPGATGSGSLVREPAASFAVGSSILDGMCFAMSDAGGNLVLASAIGCPGTVGDPKLGALQDNGGPTLTMAIGTSGDAIDKLNPSGGQCGAATDQRGATRPSLVRCDIGAYEVAPPIASTGDASQIGTTSAKAGGTLDPRGLRTSWHVEYGTSSSYGNVTADQFANGGGSAAVAATLTGLSPDTTYHYRLVAGGPDGTSNGDDRTFTTSKLPPPVPTPPKITGLKLKPRKFRVSGRKAGTTISYRDSVAALATFVVLRPARGVRVKGRCLKPSRKRHGKRCTRYIAVGRFTHLDVAGLNRFHWGGKAGGHKLRRGSYRLRVVPVAGVLAGRAVTVSFRVVK